MFNYGSLAFNCPMHPCLATSRDPQNLFMLGRVGALSRSQSGGRSNVAFTRSFQRAAGGIGGSRRPARGGGSGGRGRGRGGSRVVTQADLDKDLEAYMEE